MPLRLRQGRHALHPQAAADRKHLGHEEGVVQDAVLHVAGLETQADDADDAPARTDSVCIALIPIRTGGSAGTSLTIVPAEGAHPWTTSESLDEGGGAGKQACGRES